MPRRNEHEPNEGGSNQGSRLLVAILLASVIAAYAVVVAAIYMLVTSVSGRLLVAGGVHILFLYSVLPVVMRIGRGAVSRDETPAREAPSSTARRLATGRPGDLTTPGWASRSNAGSSGPAHELPDVLANQPPEDARDRPILGACPLDEPGPTWPKPNSAMRPAGIERACK